MRAPRLPRGALAVSTAPLAVQVRSDVWLCPSLPRETVEAAHLRYAPDVTATLARIIGERRAALGREPSVCVLPHGQLTVPRVGAG